MMYHPRQNEKGNALWFILVAIALLTALTMTITRSSDTVEQSGNIERLRVQATEIMRFTKGLEQTIAQMRMRGAGENELSFDVSFLSGYNNANCTVSDCMIFDVGGGGLNFRPPKTEWMDVKPRPPWAVNEFRFNANNAFQDVETTCGTPSCVDLTAQLLYIKKNLCIELNNMLNIPNPGGNPPVDTSMDSTKFTGSYTYSRTVGDEAGSAGVAGKKAACIEDSNDTTNSGYPSYHFYHVLIAR